LGHSGPTRTPHEQEVWEEKNRISYDVFNKDLQRRKGGPLPFPLEKIYYYTDEGKEEGVYDHDDPEYLKRISNKAHLAICIYRRYFYYPGLLFNKEQLKIATDFALDLRAQRPDFRNVPLAEKPDNPTENDFIQSGEWFFDYETAIIKGAGDGVKLAKTKTSISSMPEVKDKVDDGFKCLNGQAFYNGIDLKLPVGQVIEILEKLIQKISKTVLFSELESSSVNDASDQLRTNIGKIRKAFERNKIPFSVESKKTYGYVLTPLK
jgi:hypothetical protein